MGGAGERRYAHKEGSAKGYTVKGGWFWGKMDLGGGGLLTVGGRSKAPKNVQRKTGASDSKFWVRPKDDGGSRGRSEGRGESIYIDR